MTFFLKRREYLFLNNIYCGLKAPDSANATPWRKETVSMRLAEEHQIEASPSVFALCLEDTRDSKANSTRTEISDELSYV